MSFIIKSASMSQEFLLTKVIATLGPASESPLMIRQLIEEGVDVFRLNFSHGSMEMHAELLDRIRQVSMNWTSRWLLWVIFPGPRSGSAKCRRGHFAKPRPAGGVR